MALVILSVVEQRLDAVRAVHRGARVVEVADQVDVGASTGVAELHDDLLDRMRHEFFDLALDSPLRPSAADQDQLREEVRRLGEQWQLVQGTRARFRCLSPYVCAKERLDVANVGSDVGQNRPASDLLFAIR